MAKCKLCGRKKLFLKLDSAGLCPECSKLSEVAKATADLKVELEDLKSKKDKLYSETSAARATLQEVQKEVFTAREAVSKYRCFAKSIKSAMSVILCDNHFKIDMDEVERWQALDLDDLLPEPDLQCLTVKDLAAQYRRVRKDITSVCSAYENRYNTKTIMAMYKLMTLALESEFENILYRLRYGDLEKGIMEVKELTAKYYSIASDGNQSIAPTLKRFIVQIETLYLEALNIEYEYYVQRERAKEEQRAIREQMRQEAEERKRLEQERKKVEAEENKYRQEIERITIQMQQAHDAELEELRKRLEEMNALVTKVEEKKEEIINLQNGKAGTVYIISNIGSFGDNVYKIGMTRRIEPQDRVNELGDASVPFPFDVHSFIFSEDAVALETALHHELNDRRVNKVNLRKEFFNVSIEELQKIVERVDPTAPFKVTALAEQYRQSISIQ